MICIQVHNIYICMYTVCSRSQVTHVYNVYRMRRLSTEQLIQEMCLQ